MSPSLSIDTTAPQVTRPAELGRVLVMDSDAHHRYIYQRALNHAGYHVDAVTSLPEAKHLLARHQYAVFLGDVETAVLNGEFERLAALCNDLTKQDTSVIMVADEGHYHLHSQAAGAAGFITKPIQVRPLVSLVNDLTSSGK